MNTGHLTPKQAADRAKTGRTTIMRALYTGELLGIRDNRNRWKISPDALDDWAKDRQDTGRTPSTDIKERTPDTDTLVRLAVLETQLEATKTALEEAQKDRDHWRAQATALTVRPSLWSRLTGR